MRETSVMLFVTTLMTAFSASSAPVRGESVQWLGFGGDGKWSNPVNWSSDPFLPQSGDDVFHLNADLILMDMGTAQSPVPIRSFTMDPASGGGMTIQASKGLAVTTDFLPTVTPQAGQFYFLTLDAGASLNVTTTIAYVDATLAAGAPGNRTGLSADFIKACRGSIASEASLVASDMDMRDAYPYTDWTVSGTATVLITSSIQGVREWTLQGASQFQSHQGPYNFDRLLVLDQAKMVTVTGSGNLFINELLRIESLVQLDKIRLVAGVGSVVEIVDGGIAKFLKPSIGAQPAVEMETLQYGLSTGLANQLTGVGGIALRGAAAAISKLEGPGSVLTLFVADGDFEIESRIHNEASAWDTSGVDLQLRNVGFGNMSEVVSPDFDGIWFADSPCIKPWKSLLVDCIGVNCQATVLVDAVKNSLPLGFPWLEAMYVDGDVTVSEYATLDPNNIYVYYTGTYSGQGPKAADETRFQHEDKTLYGDFNGDCAITPLELLALRQIITGVKPYDPLYDFDCDGVINDAVEKTQWLNNWYNGVFPCAPQGATSGDGKTLTDEELAGLAEWIAADMTTAELVVLVDLVSAKARARAGTPLGDELATLANKLVSLE